MTRAARKPLAQSLAKSKSALSEAAHGDAKPRRASVGANTDRPDRRNKINVTGYFDAAVRKSIRMIQVEHPELTQQDLLAEALNLLFSKYSVPETAKMPSAGENTPAARGKRTRKAS